MTMKWKPLSEVVAGECLAGDVEEEGGQILLKQGAALSERALAMLVQRGITEIPVHVAIDPDVLEHETRRIDEMLEHRFRHCRDSGLMREIRSITRRVMLAQLTDSQ